MNFYLRSADRSQAGRTSFATPGWPPASSAGRRSAARSVKPQRHGPEDPAARVRESAAPSARPCAPAAAQQLARLQQRDEFQVVGAGRSMPRSTGVMSVFTRRPSLPGKQRQRIAGSPIRHRPADRLGSEQGAAVGAKNPQAELANPAGHVGLRPDDDLPGPLRTGTNLPAHFPQRQPVGSKSCMTVR